MEIGLSFRRLLQIWMIVFTVIVLYLLSEARQAAHHNSDRIDDIQASRLHSCERNYQSFKDVFRPFFPNDRNKWTKRQKKDWEKLVQTTRRLTQRCKTQVKERA